LETKESLVAYIQTKLTPPISMESLMTVPTVVPISKTINESLIDCFSKIQHAPVVDEENVFLIIFF
jgi:hypothetical protein